MGARNQYFEKLPKWFTCIARDESQMLEDGIDGPRKRVWEDHGGLNPRVAQSQLDLPQTPQSHGYLTIHIGQGEHFYFFLNHMLLHLNHNIKNEKRLNKG